MTSEQKQLLIKDLCARLPYKVKLDFYSKAMDEHFTCTLLGIEPDGDMPIIAKVDMGAFTFTADHVKPYLRRMSSMTKGEKKIYTEISSHLCGEIAAKNLIDWLNKRHLDYRYLIEEGLALEADEDIYDLTQL